MWSRGAQEPARDGSSGREHVLRESESDFDFLMEYAIDRVVGVDHIGSERLIVVLLLFFALFLLLVFELFACDTVLSD
jgi:hypothetical protein